MTRGGQEARNRLVITREETPPLYRQAGLAALPEHSHACAVSRHFHAGTRRKNRVFTANGRLRKAYRTLRTQETRFAEDRQILS